MNISKAIKATKLLQQKEQLEEFFRNIKELPKICGITVQVNLIGEDGQFSPVVAHLSPEIVLPCLKEQLEAVKRGIDNL